jgi:hypothetical protein
MKVILLSNLSALTVPDEGYSAFQSFSFDKAIKSTWKQ